MRVAAAKAALQGLRVFIVEDEAIIAMSLEDLLASLGCVVVGFAGTVAQALVRIADPAMEIDAAILDVNMGDGETSFPIAEALLALDVPFVFATGYARSVVAERYPAITTLSKPYSPEVLSVALADAVSGRKPSGLA